MYQQFALSAVMAESTGRQVLLLAPLALISLTLMVVALVDLARRESVRGSKLFWAIAIVVAGTLGPIAYFVFARKET